MNLSLSMMLSSFNVGYCSVAVGSASRCLRGSARSQRLRWKQRSGRSTVDRRHDSWPSARWAVDLARRAMEHEGGRRRPDLGGRRARGRTEEPPGTDLHLARLGLWRSGGAARAPRLGGVRGVRVHWISAVAAGGERWCVGVGGGVP